MEMELLLLLFLVSSTASVNISLTSGELCEGAVATWTCVVEGTSLGWRNLGENEFPSSLNDLVSLGPGSPFNTTLTSVNGTIITSIATAYLTSAINGSFLECSDGTFESSGTTTRNVTLLLEDSSTVRFIFAEPTGSILSEIVIYSYWQKAVCAPSYQLNITSSNGNVNENILTANTFYLYPVPAIDNYTFSVIAFDYFGEIIGTPISTTVHIKQPNVTINSSFNCDSNTISIIIQDSADNQLPITSCSIRLMSDDGSYFDEADCTQGNLFEFTNITYGQSYTYIVTVHNIFDSTTKAGEINIPEPAITMSESSLFCSPTMTSIPPTPKREVHLWVLIVIIVLCVMLSLAIAFITLELCWRLRCCNLNCWDSIFWSYLFCDCFRKCCAKGEKIKATNGRTESPGGKETKM